MTEKAEKLGVQVIEFQKRVLRAAHLLTLVSMNNLALTYADQKKVEGGRKLRGASNKDEEEGAGTGASRDTKEHGQFGIKLPELGSIE